VRRNAHRRHHSPVQLTALISKEHVRGAAGAQVLPDDGDLGAPGFGAPARGQSQHRRGLRSPGVH